MKPLLIITYASFLFFMGCDFKVPSFYPTKTKKGVLAVYENNYVFSTSEVELHPHEVFSYEVSNHLKKESFYFVILKKEEDPVLVQQLFEQNGELSKDYYLYKSPLIKPGESKKVKFSVPSSLGVYHFVALLESAKDSLFGSLIVKSKPQINKANKAKIKVKVKPKAKPLSSISQKQS